MHLPGKAGQLLESLLNSQAKVTVGSSGCLSGWRLVWKRRFKSSKEMMLFAEVRAAKPWMDSDMKDFFYDSNGHQVRAQWTFLKNIDSSNPMRSFFPRLKPRTTEDAQNNRTERTTSSEATVTEEGEGENEERNRATEKGTGARRKTTRSRSPRVEITDVQDEEEEGGKEGGEEGGEWHTAVGGKNGRGGNGGGNRGGPRGGRGSDRGGRRERSGKGGVSSSQSTIHQFMDSSTPCSRLAVGATGGSAWVN